MTFNPAAFENLEALKANEAREADRDQIDAKIAAEGVDFDGAKNLMYGDLTPRTPEEIKEAKIAEANEPDAEEQLLTALNGAESGDEISQNTGEAQLVGGDGKNILKGQSEKDGLEESVEQVAQIVPEGEYTALFKHFLQQGSISPEDYSALTKAKITSENYHTEISSLDINPQKKTELVKSLGYMNNPERIKEGKQELHTEFSEIFEPYIKKINGEIEWNSTFSGEAFERIAQHYIGGRTKTSEEKKVDFKMACTMAADDLGKRAQISLNTSNTEYFNTNFRIAKNPNSSEVECFNALTNISQIINKTEGVKGKTKLTEQMRNSGRKKLSQIQKYNEFIQLIADRVTARQEENTQKIAEIEATLNVIKQEAKLTPGELTALGGGEEDIISNSLPEKPSESA